MTISRINTITLTKSVIFCALFSVQVATAQSYFSPIIDDVPEGIFARQTALGFSQWGGAGSSVSLLSNPALLASTDAKHANFDGNVGGLSISEKRSFPVVDSFGDFLADNVYVVNKGMYPSVTAGLNVRLFDRLYLACRIDQSHARHVDYNEEVRGAAASGTYLRDPLVGYNRIRNVGNLKNISCGAAFRPMKNLTLGGSVQWIGLSNIQDKYEIEVTLKSNYLSSDETITYGNDVQTEPAIRGVIGASYKLFDRLNISLAYQTPYKIQYKSQTLEFFENPNDALDSLVVDSLGVLTKSEYRYPQQIRLGFAFKPTNVVPTEIFLDLIYENWKSFDVKKTVAASANPADFPRDLIDLKFNMKNVWKVKFGVEHQLFSGVPLRFGYFYDPSSMDESLNRNWFTAGTGFRFGKMTVDISGAFTNSEYRAYDLFPISVEKRVNKDTVRETYLLGQITAQYAF